jgi:cytolysin-activating lysine-acyltransferase
MNQTSEEIAMSEQTNSSAPSDRAAGSQQRQINAEQMAALFRSAAFGDVVSVLMRAPKHKTMSLDGLRTFVLPAIVNNQFLLAQLRHQEKKGALAAGVALWASVSDDVDKRLRADPAQRLNLSFNDWKGGSNLWLVDLVAPTQLARSILNDLEEKVARGRPMAAKIVSSSGETRLTTLQDLIAGSQKEPA